MFEALSHQRKENIGDNELELIPPNVHSSDLIPNSCDPRKRTCSLQTIYALDSVD